MAQTQAVYFTSRGYPSNEELTAAGGVFQNGWWIFPDGSRGRSFPMEGRFIAYQPEVEIPGPLPE